MNEVMTWGLCIGVAVLSDIPLAYNYTANGIRQMMAEGRSPPEITDYLNGDARYFPRIEKLGFNLARKVYRL